MSRCIYCGKTLEKNIKRFCKKEHELMYWRMRYKINNETSKIESVLMKLEIDKINIKNLIKATKRIFTLDEIPMRDGMPDDRSWIERKYPCDC